MVTRERDIHLGAGRERAVRAVERALLALDGGTASPDQLSDVADAIDALKDRTFGVAFELASAAINTRRRLAKSSMHPSVDTLTLAELQAAFAEVRGARS